MDKRASTRTLYQQIYQALYQAIQDERECEAITQRLLSHYFQLDPVDKVLDTPIQLTTEQHRLLGNAIERLNNHEPIQYVLGEAPFLDRNFQVNPAVLIPRPETEAMVQDIINDNPPKGTYILDLCTGSGCIAITLQLAIAQSQVWGLDIDSAALQTAQANAQQLGAQVQWLQADLLHDPLPDRHWHIIVSNPPYVRPSEQIQMHQRVLAHEPAQALFVPEDQPLVFHERIVALACRHLLPGGQLYLEINEVLGNEVANLLTENGFEDISINQDLHGKDRWVAGTWQD
ncbi:MAG: peptide chain release factor N(5)-glutamine methyltransferase [Bacteroidota bacterium]